MPREIIRINQIDRRLPEHGRIRLGEKGAKNQPVKLDKFRFTSHDCKAIEEIAALYGGDVKAWEQGQWEVKTTATTIPVVLPPEPLGGTPVYELWSKGGCQRRCDGETAVVPRSGPEGSEMVDEPCLCAAAGVLSCKPTTRLTVVLPDITFGGGWRLESGGWNVAQEMPGMVEAILQFSQRGFTRAHLSLEQRKSVSAGRTRQFVVPVLRPDVSLDALLAGEGGLRALAPGEPSTVIESMEALERSETPIVPPVDTKWEDEITRDDEIVDAEIVGEGQDLGNHTPSDGDPAPSPTLDPERPFADDAESVGREVRRKHMMALLRDLGMGTTERHALVRRVTNGTSSSSNDLSLDGLNRVVAALNAIKAGKAEMSGINEDGMAVVVKV